MADPVSELDPLAANVTGARHALLRFGTQRAASLSRSPRNANPEFPLRTNGVSPEDSLQFLKGVGPERAKRLARLGLVTIEDLLWHLPKGYLDRSRIVPIRQLVPGAEHTTLVEVTRQHLSGGRGRIALLEVHLRDASGEASAIFFGQAFLAKVLLPGTRLLLHGKVKWRVETHGRLAAGGLQFQNPEYEVLGADGVEGALQGGRVVPVYALTAGVSQKMLRVYVRHALDAVGPRLIDPLPASMRERLALTPLRDAFERVHYPERAEDAEPARDRLAFDEFLALQLAFGTARRLRGEASPRRSPASPRFPAGSLAEAFRRVLPFQLTAGQERVWSEIAADLALPRPMNRLLQGDVGSGKTAVAALACLTAIEGGQQAAYLAPTEILAEQQARNLSRWFGPLGLNVELLLGRSSGRERRVLLSALEAGEIDLLVGTHALLESAVEWKDLGLIVVDEQHRFGVMQRARLREKGGAPHCLVMSATPIPRSLAMTLYGDLDLSVLDEMPPGRLPPETRLVPPEKRDDMLRWIAAHAHEGARAYIVYPLVEESELLDLKAATEAAEELRAHPDFRDLEIGLLLGRMDGEEKQRVLDRFRGGQCAVLVSTTVIEVGVDVPEATVMVVEHPERFGLAQLHQLRGRVGRGGGASHFLLSLSGRVGRTSLERLKILLRESSGFRVAEADLRLRGPGEILGTAQHGLPPLRVADLTHDQRWLFLAHEEANRLAAQDPRLIQPEHHELRRWVDRLFAHRLPLSRVG
ncbi:MAG: ATP-dependent DNA helicase RecG [Candidatus Eisenbacteria bacterium]